MAYQGETPWHGLGTRMPGQTDVAAALSAGNLNWTVGLRDLFLKDGRLVKGRKAVERDIDNAVLGTVGSGFRLIQNSDAFGILEPAVREHGVTIESAGALGNGGRTWMLAKLPTSIEPVAGDEIRGYFLIVNGHDGTQAYGARPTPIRVVCQNTLSMATSTGKDIISIRHTTNAAKRLDAAAKLVERLTAAMKSTGETFSQLAGRKMGAVEIAKYIETVFPTPPDVTEVPDSLLARRKTVSELVWGGRGAELAGADANGATAWAAYNAVTEYFDHVRPAEAKSAGAREKANVSALFGEGDRIKVRALSVARQLVAA